MLSNMKSRDLPYNYAQPLVMHIDLNSCFAIIEQQSNRMLRGRPVGVAAYDTPRGFILAASYQAKAKGVKLGVNVQQAREMCPGIIIVTPDPAKYREAHRRFKELMLEYTSDVAPKSIDEFVLHLANSPVVRSGKTMEQIGHEIKEKVAERLGEAVTVNIGIGPNRFLAKFAAGFGKPDGMTRIDHSNLEQIYDGMDLVDLPGINVRYRRRLQMYGINSPLEFLQADRRTLEKVIFKSITGYYWYLRLRGYEIDKYESKRSSIGHQYALPHKTWDRDELARLLLKLCEKVGRRLRKVGMAAKGIHLYISFINYQNVPNRDNGFLGGENLESKRAWHRGEKLEYNLYSTESVYKAAKHLLDQAELYNKVRGMAITTFNLEPVDPEQLNLFEVETDEVPLDPSLRPLRKMAAQRRLSDALDVINNRYGEFKVTPAAMMDMQGEILDRVAFGNVRDV
jgi:DNA polymerase-4